MLPGEELSQDHIFGRAFGGKAKVRAHRKCNNESGMDAEGGLQKSDTLHNFLKQLQGRGRPVPMVSASGRGTEIDLHSQRVHSSPNVKVEQNGGQVSVRIEGLASKAESAYEGYRAKHPEFPLPAFGDLPPSAIAHDPQTEFTVTLKLPLALAEAVALKAASGAGTYAYGPAFPATAFGQALRSRAATPTTEADRRAGLTAGGLDGVVAGIATRVGFTAEQVGGLPRMAPRLDGRTLSVLFVPNGRETWLLAHFMSFPTPPYGIRIPAPLPALTPGLTSALPVLLRDAPGQMEIVDYNALLLQPALEALQLPEDESP